MTTIGKGGETMIRDPLALKPGSNPGGELAERAVAQIYFRSPVSRRWEGGFDNEFGDTGTGSTAAISSHPSYTIDTSHKKIVKLILPFFGVRWLPLSSRYCDTNSNVAIGTPLRAAVSDTNDDVRRWALTDHEFVMFNKEVISLLEQLLDGTIHFMRQSALIGMAVILKQQDAISCPKSAEFCERCLRITSGDMLTRFSAILTCGILDASGCNMTISLQTLTNTPAAIKLLKREGEKQKVETAILTSTAQNKKKELEKNGGVKTKKMEVGGRIRI
ncbi:hypothetical protein Aperf_G00000054410 [Anoplocephala perfoliata]